MAPTDPGSPSGYFTAGPMETHFVGDGCFPDGHRSEPIAKLEAQEPWSLPADMITPETIIGGVVASAALDARDGPVRPLAPWALDIARAIVAELERYGFVIVNPSRTAAEPIAAAYEGKGPLRIVKAAGSVLRATGEVE